MFGPRQFTDVSTSVYPVVYEKLAPVFHLVNFDIGFILSSSCILNLNFYDRLMFATIGPIGVISMMGATYAVAARQRCISPDMLAVMGHRLIAAGVFVVLFVYSSATFTIFQTFVCDEIGTGNTYLRADYSISCLTRKHRVYTWYALVMIAIFPLGVPAFFAWWLVRNQRDLKTANRESVPHVQPFKRIWIAYKPSRYFSEVLECGRRTMLAGSAVFVQAGHEGSAAIFMFSVSYSVVFLGPTTI